jgi:hypothetical protein
MAISDLGEHRISGSGVSIPLRMPSGAGFLKVFAAGELTAQGGDRRMLIRLNSESQGYKGYVSMTGNHTLPQEWDSSGFFLGHNGWALNASFMAEFTLAFQPNAKQVSGSGFSTFSHGNGTMLGYECHGVFVTQSPIQRFEIGFDEGAATGTVRLYLF